MAAKSTTTKKTTTKSAEAKAAVPSLGAVVMLYTKSSSHGIALLAPKIIAIEGQKFLEGTQVTGKAGHRMERKRTLVPFDHVASLVEFSAEEDLWSEPQPKHLRLPDETKPPVALTSHEQPNSNARPPHRSNHRDRHGRHRGRSGQPQSQGQPNDNDARLQARYDARRDRDFER